MGVERLVHDWLSRTKSLLCRITAPAVAGTTLLLAGCEGPFSTLDPAGPAARDVAVLWWAMFAVAALVLLAVAGLWLYAAGRRRAVADERQAARTGLHWIVGGGLLLPGVAIVTLLWFGIPVGHRMLPLPVGEDGILRVDVTAHQWRWEVVYRQWDIRLEDEIHVPVGAPVDIHLTSADVIHSFWVPRLGGKLDAMPGRTNVLRIQADRAGTYRGQCAEFCGVDHAHMKFTVTAHPATAFDTWLQEARTDD